MQSNQIEELLNRRIKFLVLKNIKNDKFGCYSFEVAEEKMILTGKAETTCYTFCFILSKMFMHFIQGGWGEVTNARKQ